MAYFTERTSQLKLPKMRSRDYAKEQRQQRYADTAQGIGTALPMVGGALGALGGGILGGAAGGPLGALTGASTGLGIGSSLAGAGGAALGAWGDYQTQDTRERDIEEEEMRMLLLQALGGGMLR